MSTLLLNVALAILLLAAAAFVMDVLSPFTPTPTASLITKLMIVVFCILKATLWIDWSRSLDPELCVTTQRFVARPAQRTLIALICCLLC
jgi:hypothetical protein